MQGTMRPASRDLPVPGVVERRLDRVRRNIPSAYRRRTVRRKGPEGNGRPPGPECRFALASRAASLSRFGYSGVDSTIARPIVRPIQNIGRAPPPAGRTSRECRGEPQRLSSPPVRRSAASPTRRPSRRSRTQRRSCLPDAALLQRCRVSAILGRYPLFSVGEPERTLSPREAP